VALGEAIGIDCLRADHTRAVDIPIAIRRRGAERKIILLGTSMATFRDPGLIKLIADAHHWFELITRGTARTVRDLARKVHIDEGDVSRSLPLAFLALDIVEMILDRKQPPEFRAEKLKRLHTLAKS
jgi:site-specific DNA recombinase